jgi:PHD/YefM family antitoxin component YafN of YafNO toxin-antitoxin module
MTVPHTLTLREAESRLRELVKQAQATREPIVVTTEETAEPIAVLTVPYATAPTGQTPR